ncbi:putative lipid II flippase FtsW [Ruicaihuangia caeni]|uniref:Probable peptidoglycan glycosyltransferase FtsW n=1 Tax=Ruicaihuangia caeni TaxID=3042517 RepID=A0AAW6T838_9MICO|nr:putative lipid II flippase FtsW [Klugiella sp. YN-L-19]MDI2098243.1 putative lipid II flippase FtsW [Klugiella sp. YN-L-19]
MTTSAEQPRTRSTEPEQSRGRGSEPRTAVVAIKRIFAAEGANYFLLLGTTIFLVVLGLVMVLSSSAVESLRDGGGGFSGFTNQGLYALIGVPLMLVVSRLPVSFFKRWAPIGIAVGIVLQLLVFTPLGWGYGGNRNWLSLAGFSMQPSELVKLALCLWLAWVLSAKPERLHDWRQLLKVVAPVAAASIGLVLVGNDLGTAVIMLAIVFGSLFFAGVRLRFLVVPGILIGMFGVLFAQLSASRRARIEAWLSGCETDYLDTCWQVQHGTWALASGGVFGVGLGNSRTKWSWLPEAENDFIFAIIGEELGLLGAAVVLLLFVVLAIAFVRIIRQQRDPFSRIVASGIMVWVISQAFVNIAVVLGILPVLGVPLPLISAGGSALITTLLGIGVALALARNRAMPTGAVGAPASERGGAA